MARVRVLTMKFPRVTKIGQSIASMRTTPQVSGLGPVTVYIARFKCRAGLGPDRAYLFQLGSAHQKVAPGRARSTRLHCHLFCRAVLDPGRALSICGSVNVAIDRITHTTAIEMEGEKKKSERVGERKGEREKEKYIERKGERKRKKEGEREKAREKEEMERKSEKGREKDKKR